MKINLKTTVFLFLSCKLLAQSGPVPANSIDPNEVYELITDFGGYFRSTEDAPEMGTENQNVLAIRTNMNPGVYFTTGINDQEISDRLGIPFCSETLLQNCVNQQAFRAFPSKYLSKSKNPMTTTTKNLIGLAKQDYDNGKYLTYPNDLRYYLDDGKEGLNILTAVFNIELENGVINYNDILITENSIDDGIPDVIVTQNGQLAQSGADQFDQYFFGDRNNITLSQFNNNNNYPVVVGETYRVNFSEIGVVFKGEYSFFNHLPNAAANALLTYSQHNSSVVQNGHSRDIRILALDWKDLGITLSNYENVRSFNQKFNGSSDIAFAAYNERSLRFIRKIFGSVYKVELDGITTNLFSEQGIELKLCVSEDGVVNESRCQSRFLNEPIGSTDVGKYLFDNVPSNFPSEKYIMRIKLNNQSRDKPYYVVDNMENTINEYVEFELTVDDVENVDFIIGNFCMKEPYKSTVLGGSRPVAISTMSKEVTGWPNIIPNAYLVLSSKNKGLVIPRTTSDMIGAVGLEEGMIIYDTNDNCIKLYDGSKWVCIERNCNDPI